VERYVPPETLLENPPDIAAKGCDGLWLNPGTDPRGLAEPERLGPRANPGMQHRRGGCFAGRVLKPVLNCAFKLAWGIGEEYERI